jgi:hypothetical protein
MYLAPPERRRRVNEEPRIPRRYVTIHGRGGKKRRLTAEVWDSIPGREDKEVWLKAVRPVVRLAKEEDKNTYSLMGKVHAALSEVGLRRRAQRFIMQAYYLGSYEEVRRLAAEEFVEFE